MSPSKKTEVKRFMRSFERPELDLVFLLQDVEDPVNVGAIFRVADGLKAKEIVLTGISARPPHKLITKVGRGKEKRVPWRYIEDVEEAVRGLKTGGYQVSAIEISGTAAPYDEVEYPTKTGALVGHEDHGVTKRALAHVDRTVFIPMYGKGASLNVHVALSVVAFHVLHRARHPEGP